MAVKFGVTSKYSEYEVMWIDLDVLVAKCWLELHDQQVSIDVMHCCRVCLNSDLGMAESLFVRLDGSGTSYQLHLQYRMNRYAIA